MRRVLFVSLGLLCACGTSKPRTGPDPEPAERAAAPEVRPVSGAVEQAPLAAPEIVVRIARARLPQSTSDAERGEMEAIVSQLRAGRASEAAAAWRSFRERYLQAHPEEEPGAVRDWLMRKSFLETTPGVMDATATLARHDAKRAALREEVALAREIANSVIETHLIRYERLDPATMKRAAPRRMAAEELVAYADNLEGEIARLDKQTQSLEKSLETAVTRRRPVYQRLSNALARFDVEGKG